MKKVFCVLILFFAFLIKANCRNSQKDGIKWTEGLTWEEILKKAKNENKYVLVDCYATWCAPCKVMDLNVYPDGTVGTEVNEKFIPVRVQMNKTEKDDESVKKWYNDAVKLEKEYQINAYPTFLFFSPDGKLVHKVAQGYDVTGFLDLLSIALDPKKQYYSMMADYQNGKRDPFAMRELARSTKNFGDKKLAGQIADDYISTLKPADLYNAEIKKFVGEFFQNMKARQIAARYIDKLKEQEVYANDNIIFMRQFTESSKDRGFRIFYNNPIQINKIMDANPLPAGLFSFIARGDYAQSAVRNIIFSEEIENTIFKAALANPGDKNDPDWTKIKLNIQKKYPKSDVLRIVTDGKVAWYNWTKNWPEYSKSLIAQMDIMYKGKSLAGNSFFINNNCWSLFERAMDTAILNRAIYWMEEMFKQNEQAKQWSTAMDTYANLLYKVGRRSEALNWQEKAVAISKNNENLTKAFEKMKRGEPTWPN